MSILVVGSINTDLVVKSKRLPSPGETVLGDQFNSFGGGKGANQAVAAARAGASVAFVGAVGDDDFGKARLADLDRYGVDTRCVRTVSGISSGVALILVDSSGENMISVSPGANHRITTADIDAAFKQFPDRKIVLTQMEIPFDVVEYLARRCAETGKTFILNPAPCPIGGLPVSLIKAATIITPNRTEFALLGGPEITDIRDEKTVKQAQAFLKDKKIPTMVLSLGKDGAALFDNGKSPVFVPAPKVKAVDAVGAGDCLNGVLAAGIAAGKSIETALKTAVIAASISVTHPGAQSGMPSKADIEAFNA